VVISVLLDNGRIALHSLLFLIHSIIIQCIVNLTPNTDDLKETGWEGGNETHLPPDRGMAVSLKKVAESSSVPYGGNFLTS
jgi:hypothetical protein